VAFGALVGAVIVTVPPPFVSIVAPGSRIKVTAPAPEGVPVHAPEPVPEVITVVPVIVRVPDIKYTPAAS
jgi:hypothetical protein